MVRASLCSMVVLAIFAVGFSRGDEPKKQSDSKATAKGKITKISPKKDSITVKLKDKDGKDTEKTFKLVEDIEYFDSTGKVAVLDIFKSGDEVLLVEADGKLKTLKKDPKAKPSTEKDK